MFTVNSMKSDFSQESVVQCFSCDNIVKTGEVGVGPYLAKNLRDGEIKIENSRQILFFDAGSRLLTKFHDKASGKSEKLEFEIGAYPTLAGESGAYIFMKDNSRSANLNLKDISEVIGQSKTLFRFVIEGL